MQILVCLVKKESFIKFATKLSNKAISGNQLATAVKQTKYCLISFINL